MIYTVFGIKVRMPGLCINRYRLIIGRLLDTDYRPADNRPLPYRCISSFWHFSPFPVNGLTTFYHCSNEIHYSNINNTSCNEHKHTSATHSSASVIPGHELAKGQGAATWTAPLYI